MSMKAINGFKMHADMSACHAPVPLYASVHIKAVKTEVQYFKTLSLNIGTLFIQSSVISIGSASQFTQVQT